ncbi:nuclear autoantigenic sperm protein [Lethenteron reissneri]|uniref:nuclear autoantigenic sperm protein n=1 Tax=Lethenteron reissneri TaxID=7753 RepID=UPI002AB6FE50|nr:nuclear autoantigenic sperm protein [Lethenteron reissneri]
MASAVVEHCVTPSKIPLPADDEEEEEEEDEEEDCPEILEVATAIQLLEEGKQNLADGNIPSAVDALQDSCALLAKEFGETANQCGEAYMVYGKALLELARIENGIVGKALEGMPLEEAGVSNEECGDTDIVADDVQTEEEMEQLREKVYDAMSEGKLSSDAEEDVGFRDGETEVVGMQVQEQKDSEDKSAAEDKAVEGDQKVEVEMAESVVTNAVAKSTATNGSFSEEKPYGSNSDEKPSCSSGSLEKPAAPEESVVANAVDKPTCTDGSNSEEKPSCSSGSLEKPAAPEESVVANAVDKPTCTDGSNSEEKPSCSSGSLEKPAAPEESVVANAVDKPTCTDGSNSEEKPSCSSGSLEKPAALEDTLEEPAVLKRRSDPLCPDSMEHGTAHSNDLKETSGLVNDEVDKNQGQGVISNGKHDAPREALVKVDSKPTAHSSMDIPNGPKMDLEEGDEAEVDMAEDVAKDTNDVDDSREEVSHMQLAWEMLDLARVICTRQRNREAQLHAAEALLKLGELGLEKDNYQQATEDFLQCLAIQQKYLEPDSRHLAETHYQLGIAYSLEKNYSAAVEHFSSSLKCINKRLALLSEGLEEVEPAQKTPEVAFALAEDQKEIAALKELLPEIQSKILDCEELQDQPEVSKVIKESMVDSTEEIKTIACEVKDISHLVKKKPAQCGNSTEETKGDAEDISHLVKKRKLEGDDAENNSDTKKPKQTLAEDSIDDAEENLCPNIQLEDESQVKETAMEVMV